MPKHSVCQTTTMILMLFVRLIQVTECERLKCSPVQFAERNKPFVVACNATDSVTDVYWYHGEDTSDFPILVYESGNQRGTAYQKGEYELTSNFYLKIINTQIKHEGSYTVRIYFHDHRYEEITTTVRVFDLPSPPCPYVDACGLSCNGCAIGVNTTGYLVCYVNGSRPGFDIDWGVEKPFGISYAKQEQRKRYNENRETWHTERNISYSIDRCGINATFHCKVDAPISKTTHILETFSISVQINSDNCQTPISTEISNNGTVNIVIICSVFAFAFGTVSLILFFLRRKGAARSSNLPEEGNTTMEEKKKILITNLLTVYEKLRFVKPLPWEEPIPISILYTVPPCTVTNPERKIRQIRGSKLLEKDFILRNDRIYLVADFGQGKTTFTKFFAEKWIASQRNENDQTTMDAFILIYIHLKDVKGNELLSDIIKNMLPVGHELTSKDIDEILHAYVCILVFVGLDEMSMSTGQDFEEQCDTNVTEETAWIEAKAGKDDQSELTVANILSNTIHSSLYQKLKVWVTSSYIHPIHSAFALPYSKVYLQRFTENDVKAYISKTCKYYLESHGKGGAFKSVENDVARLIEVNEIVQNFCETPLLLMMIIHIITSRLVTDNEKYKQVNLNKLTTLMKLVLLCLESRYVDKMNQHPNATKTIKKIETTLGQLAFENQCKTNSDYWKQNLEKGLAKTAVEIGLLKFVDKVELEGVQGTDLFQSSFPGIVFNHKYLKEYLAARYILESNQEWERLNEYIDKSDDEGTIRLLQFMCGLDHPEVHRLFKVLLTKQDMWNNIIDCMYEINDPEQKELILEDFKRKQSTRTSIPIINVRYLEKKYHKVALADFCKVCGEHDIKLRLGFQENCAIAFVTEVTLPPLMSLVFADMSFDQRQYVSVITTLARRRCTDELWFVRCKLPKTLSQTNKKNVDEALEATAMTIQCSEKMPGVHSISSTVTGTEQMTSYL